MSAQENTILHIGLSRKEIISCLSEANISPVFLFSQDEISKFTSSSDTSSNTVSGEPGKHIVLIDPIVTGANDLKKISLVCEKFSVPAILILESQNLLSLDPTSLVSDFIVPPVREDELLVRSIRCFETSNNSIIDGTITHGDLSINPTNYEVTIKGQRATLRFKEYELLLLLASHPGRVFDRATLLNQIWGYDYFGGTRTVDVHIRRLRSKIETNPDSSYIETIWNVGYRFRPVD